MKLTRWICPTCNEGKLAPRKPRRDDVRRYCLPCSEKKGRLVERVSPTLEKKAEARKERLRAKRRKNYEFNATSEYYEIAGIHTDANWRSYFGWFALATLRVRTTKNRGPVGLSKDGVVTLRKGPWADMYDALAQVIVGGCRRTLAVTYEGKIGVYGSKRYIRNTVEHHLQVRPKLDSLRNAEVEVSELLRAKAACELLSSGRLERKAVAS